MKIRQAALCRAIRGNRISVNSTLPPSQMVSLSAMMADIHTSVYIHVYIYIYIYTLSYSAAEADKDGDGELSFDDFLQFIRDAAAKSYGACRNAAWHMC